MAPSTNERSAIGRLGAHCLHARYDSRELTATARSAFMRRFEDEVDPQRVLPPEERARRAGHARSAYFQRLAINSGRARATAARQRVGGATPLPTPADEAKS
jgi:hypothetical protein